MPPYPVPRPFHLRAGLLGIVLLLTISWLLAESVWLRRAAGRDGHPAWTAGDLAPALREPGGADAFAAGDRPGPAGGLARALGAGLFLAFLGGRSAGILAWLTVAGWLLERAGWSVAPAAPHAALAVLWGFTLGNLGLALGYALLLRRLLRPPPRKPPTEGVPPATAAATPRSRSLHDDQGN